MSTRPLSTRAFTLVELLVSMVILLMLVLILVSITDATRKTWTYTTGKIEQFREAREAFETITRRLSQATLNTYWDYDDAKAPKNYVRQSELRFISGPGLVAQGESEAKLFPAHGIFFQAPLGLSDTYPTMKSLLNTCGYFIEYGSDKASRPSFIASPERYRFRLMEIVEPSESLTLYKYTSGMNPGGQPNCQTYVGKEWFTDTLADDAKRHPVADNIIAFILLPRLANGEKEAGGQPYADSALAPSYTYDSTKTLNDPALNPRNQLPPVVQVTMVAVDEASYRRFQELRSEAPDEAPDILEDLFTDASKYDDDLKSLEDKLLQYKLNYRIFTTSVPLKAAKWSRSQKN